jgi:hypothetical protein
MPVPDPGSTDVVLKIRRINDIKGSIKTNPLGNTEEGDVLLSNSLDPGDGTVVQFRLSKKLFNPTTGDKYFFNDLPICVVDSSRPDAKCDANTFPSNEWGFFKASGQEIFLQVPSLGSKSYKYNLFLTKTKQDGTKIADIVIDPRIKPGGVSFAANLGDDAGIKAESAGLGALELVGAAVLMLGAGVVLGWTLAGGRRPY